jgi:hypothetical protein
MAMAEPVVAVVNNEPAYVHCLSDRNRILVSFVFLSFFLSFFLCVARENLGFRSRSRRHREVLSALEI